MTKKTRKVLKRLEIWMMNRSKFDKYEQRIRLLFYFLNNVTLILWILQIQKQHRISDETHSSTEDHNGLQ